MGGWGEGKGAEGGWEGWRDGGCSEGPSTSHDPITTTEALVSRHGTAHRFRLANRAGCASVHACIACARSCCGVKRKTVQTRALCFTSNPDEKKEKMYFSTLIYNEKK